MNKPKRAIIKRHYDFSEAFYVVVTGSTFCGHMLLTTKDGHYFHVYGRNIKEIVNLPITLTEEEYRKFLREEGKKELYRIKVNVPNPEAANQKLLELLYKPWIWGVTIHNCTDFVEQVLKAGGAKLDFTFCPITD